MPQPDRRPQNPPGAHAPGDVRVILLQPAAPPKPPSGAACNGCGVCCAAEPCPLGILLSRRRRGPCLALAWEEQAALYRCAVLTEPQLWLRWLPAAWARGLTSRWIAAGHGCDCSLDTAGPLAEGMRR